MIEGVFLARLVVGAVQVLRELVEDFVHNVGLLGDEFGLLAIAFRLLVNPEHLHMLRA